MTAQHLVKVKATSLVQHPQVNPSGAKTEQEYFQDN